jgi:hypothetical protein
MGLLTVSKDFVNIRICAVKVLCPSSYNFMCDVQVDINIHRLIQIRQISAQLINISFADEAPDSNLTCVVSDEYSDYYLFLC